MAKTVSVDQLADAVMEELEEYKDLAADELKKAVKETGKSVKEDIRDNAPRKTERYAKSWKSRTMEETSESISVTVYSPNRYQLTHLLENGHAKRGGGRVRAIPHIKPAEERGQEKLEKDIAKALGGGS